MQMGMAGDQRAAAKGQRLESRCWSRDAKDTTKERKKAEAATGGRDRARAG